MNQEQILDYAHHLTDAINSVSEEEYGYAVASAQAACELLRQYDAHWMANAETHLQEGIAAAVRNHEPELLRRIGRASVLIADHAYDILNDEQLADILDLIDHASNILAQSYRNPRRREDAINLIGEVRLKLEAIDSK